MSPRAVAAADLPHRVDVEANVWLELPDGTRLGVRLWRPRTSEAVPVVLEYLPYRKSDILAPRDHGHAAWFAGHGIAFARVDIRGSGDSDGVLRDEYSADELADAPHVIAWLAEQDWCSGAVGMMGNSWGGFNALQVAAMRPPELRAVISSCASDDGYLDDVHYYGGCVLASEQMPWSAFVMPMNALPPRRAYVGDRWREMWLQRLDAITPWSTTWMEHQRRDAYWRDRAPAEDRDAITCPVLMTGGWADGYRNAILRFLAEANGPRWGIIGPWAHGFAHAAHPGPQIGYLQECLRWWRRWLGDEDNGVDRDPVLRAYLQETVHPPLQHLDRAGRWVADAQWPSPAVTTRRLAVAAEGLLDGEATDVVALRHRGAQQHGALAGAWCPGGAEADFPPDQRPEDTLCLTFDSAPLEQRVELLGRPVVRLGVRVDQPLAFVMARLCAVAPDGTSVLVSRGALNLTHRADHEDLLPLEPGERYEIKIALDAIGQAIDSGWKLRLAVSTTYWPWLWPSPEPVELTVEAGPASSLELPVRTGHDGPGVRFERAEIAEPVAHVVEELEAPYRRISHDVVTHEHAQESNQIGGERLTVDGQVLTQWFRDRWSIHEADPLSAKVECDRSATLLSDDRPELSVFTRSSMTADATTFHLLDTLEAYEGARRVFARSWSSAIPRDGV